MFANYMVIKMTIRTRLSIALNSQLLLLIKKNATHKHVRFEVSRSFFIYFRNFCVYIFLPNMNGIKSVIFCALTINLFIDTCDKYDKR